MNDKNRAIVSAGFRLLKEKKHYRQSVVVGKLAYLDCPVSRSSFCNMLNGRPAGAQLLWSAARGMQQLIRQELGMEWRENRFVASAGADWQAAEVPPLTERDPSLTMRPGFAFYADGRVSIAKKVAFFAAARREVIEFGVTLSTYAAYFFSRSDGEFKTHVADLLARGVHFKCYLLHPDSNEARLYFNDRAEVKSLETIRESLRKLAAVRQEFREAGLPGKFEVFLYRHIPNNYFMEVDGDSPEARMMVSHYLYGESRANCPVVEISRKENLLLYKKYASSLRKLVAGAQLFVPE